MCRLQLLHKNIKQNRNNYVVLQSLKFVFILVILLFPFHTSIAWYYTETAETITEVDKSDDILSSITVENPATIKHSIKYAEAVRYVFFD